MSAMRRLPLLIAVLLLAMPAAAGALRRGPGEGSLEIKDGSGVAVVQATGTIWGGFLTGRVIIQALGGSDGDGPHCNGAEKVREVGPTRTICIGQDVTFDLIGGTYKYNVRVIAVGMTVRAVGRGFAILDGSGFTDPGRYRVNGGPWQPVPSVPTKASLGASTPGSLGGK